MGPVAAPVVPRARQQGGTSALIGVIAVGVLASGSWFLKRALFSAPSASKAATESVAANAARPAAAPKASPASATGVIRTLDLDQDLGTANSAAPSTAAASEAVPNQALPSKPVPDSVQGPKQEPPKLAATNEVADPPKSADPELPLPPSADAAPTNGTEPASLVAESPVPTLLPPFDAQAAKSALTAGALSASSCRKGDDPRGTAEVIVTFAPSGRITSANVNGAPYGGTATGGCVAATLRRASVPPFAGNHVTVRKLVTIR